VQEETNAHNKYNAHSTTATNDRIDGSLLTEAQLEGKSEKPLSKL
jgi:hypothetical protein